LRESQPAALYVAAPQACEDTHPRDVDLCIDDVLATGDLDVIDSW
jgi:hypothetical protein